MNSKENTILKHMNEKRMEKFTKKMSVGKEEYLMYDLSKTHLLQDDLEECRSRLMKCKLNEKIEAMWRGDNINTTENRAVLHVLLRNREILEYVERYSKKYEEIVNDSQKTEKKSKTECKEECKIEYNEDSEEKIKEAKKVKIICNMDVQKASTRKERDIMMEKFTEAKKTEKLGKEKCEVLNELLEIHDFSVEFKGMKGFKGEKMKYIVGIGIGGSDLGPRMVCEALEAYSQGYEVYFISNVDSTDTRRVLKKVDISRTLFIVVSKTFTTQETIENYELVKAMGMGMIRQDGGDESMEKLFVEKHFVAISSNVEEVRKHKISRMFKMWDFVGGRYSLWSAVGLSIVLYVGFNNFLGLLRGASVADEDFYKEKNNSVAAACAMIDLYYADRGYTNKCLVAYDGYLGQFYKYIQQAEMESNGKKGSKQMIIWGGVGTDVQHSFFQQLHQGEQKILTEFLVAGHGIHEKECKRVKKHHEILLANCLAQSRALMVGKDSNEEYKKIDGEKPSTTIMYSRLLPETLGALIATYEHSIFVRGLCYKINSFDQYGVALGKEISKEICNALQNNDCTKFDASTNFLMKNSKNCDL